MYQNKRFLALIPARSGSKGLPDKNIRELAHKPLMAHTIDACKKSGIFDEILVSTDSKLYQEIARSYGAFVPFLRPLSLSDDTASTKDVILHAFTELKKLGRNFDYFMLLQPTSPLRNEEHIKESVKLMFSKQADSIIGVCPYDCTCYLSVTLKDTGEIDDLDALKKQIRRQDVTNGYRINGAIYLSSVPFYIEHHTFYGKKTFPYFMDPIHSIDIDDKDQFYLAELLLQDQLSSLF